jgi:phage-related protein
MEIRIDDSVENFIKQLEEATVAKVLRTVDLLEKFGHGLRSPHTKKIKDDIFELRVRGQQEVRIFYTFYKKEIVLLHGFVKKSHKIPARELDYAIKKLQRLDLI